MRSEKGGRGLSRSDAVSQVMGSDVAAEREALAATARQGQLPMQHVRNSSSDESLSVRMHARGMVPDREALPKHDNFDALMTSRLVRAGDDVFA